MSLGDNFRIGASASWPESGPDVVSRGLRDPAALLIKRLLDIAVGLLLLLPALPFGLLIALAIVLETRGPVFFAHPRVGKGGCPLRVWKFRSMVVDADAVLQDLLQAHPEYREEWRENHKLKDDPRITRVGRWLRRSSLDELPQLLNVLRGDMSMVGPRPIVEQEIPLYGPVAALYLKAKPGLTGLWQVSGRTHTTYRDRIRLDAEYLRNRTLGMDFRVLLKTVRVVLFGHGAY